MSRLGTWNVGGINGVEKREEVMNVFRKGKFDLLALTETKMKGKGEDVWCGVKCVYAGVNENVRAREGVAILLSDVWHRSMVGFECVSSRILMIKFKFERVKVCVVVTYGPSEGSGDVECNNFWNGLKGVLDKVSGGF
jgi:exonuclease III